MKKKKTIDRIINFLKVKTAEEDESVFWQILILVKSVILGFTYILLPMIICFGVGCTYLQDVPGAGYIMMPGYIGTWIMSIVMKNHVMSL